jgi:hypothetical protein
MAQSARNQSGEYWRPADPLTERIARPILAEGLCPDCGVEYSRGAQFCHICGGGRSRHPGAAPRSLSFLDAFDLAMIRRRFNLSAPSLVFLVLGIVCMVIASGIGILYNAATLAEWQTIQLWRVEWLLAASAAMLAGILLKG